MKELRINEPFEQLINREAYEYFKKNKRKVSRNLDEWKKWHSIIKGLFFAAECIAKQTNQGIYIKGIGYFAFVRLFTKKGKRKTMLTRGLPRHVYLRKFYPDSPALKNWMLSEELTTTKKLLLNFEAVEHFKNQNRGKNIYKRNRSRVRR